MNTYTFVHWWWRNSIVAGALALAGNNSSTSNKRWTRSELLHAISVEYALLCICSRFWCRLIIQTWCDRIHHLGHVTTTGTQCRRRGVSAFFWWDVLWYTQQAALYGHRSVPAALKQITVVECQPCVHLHTNCLASCHLTPCFADTSDRTRKSNAFGGKVKPGYGAKHLLARTSSSSGAGDVNPTPESPLAASLVTSSPSAEWVAAGQDAAVNQSWPGGTSQLQSTPTRGLSVTVFSKLLSKKKFRGTNSPAGNRSPSLGTSSRDSESPRSQSAEHLICSTGTGAISATPPYKQHSQEGFGSVYSTPMGPGGLQSPVTAYPDLYGGETVDLHQVQA